jgi:hypothetical protein
MHIGMTKISRLLQSLALGVTAMSMALTLTISAKIIMMVVDTSPVYVPNELSAGAESSGGRQPETNESARRSGKRQRRGTSTQPRPKTVVQTTQTSSPRAAAAPMHAEPGDVADSFSRIRPLPARPLLNMNNGAIAQY